MNPPPGHQTPANWIEYWDRDDVWSNSPLWKINACLFFRRARGVVGFRADDAVLNIGCGPGHLEQLLSPAVKQILAVDASGQFAEQCRRTCHDRHNVQVELLGNDYTNLAVFQRKFSLILCVSVVQYYRSVQEIESLIGSAKDVALPGARMLIADLPRTRGAPTFVWDAACSFGLAVREGYLWPLFCTAYLRWVRGSQYNDFRTKNPELSFSTTDLESLIHRTKVRGCIIWKNLSIYANRPSLLIQF